MADFDDDFVFPCVEMEVEEVLLDIHSGESDSQFTRSDFENLNLRVFDCWEYKQHEIECEIDPKTLLQSY